eukprot:scaffold32217_cov27-Tisochrysis_lutea.AAC.5
MSCPHALPRSEARDRSLVFTHSSTRCQPSIPNRRLSSSVLSPTLPEFCFSASHHFVQKIRLVGIPVIKLKQQLVREHGVTCTRSRCGMR